MPDKILYIISDCGFYLQYVLQYLQRGIMIPSRGQLPPPPCEIRPWVCLKSTDRRGPKGPSLTIYFDDPSNLFPAIDKSAPSMPILNLPGEAPVSQVNTRCHP